MFQMQHACAVVQGCVGCRSVECISEANWNKDNTVLRLLTFDIICAESLRQLRGCTVHLTGSDGPCNTPGRRNVDTLSDNWMTCWQLQLFAKSTWIHLISNGHCPPGLRNHLIFVMLRSLYWRVVSVQRHETVRARPVRLLAPASS